jgi:hypothetical protein
MRQGDAGSHVEQRESRSGEHGRAARRVDLHLLELIVGERSGLEQDAVRHGDLPHVVEGRRLPQQIQLVVGHAELRADPRRQLPHPARVLAGLVVPVFRREREALDDLQLGVLAQEPLVLARQGLRGGVRPLRAQIEHREQRDEHDDHHGRSKRREPQRSRRPPLIGDACLTKFLADRGLRPFRGRAQPIGRCMFASRHVAVSPVEDRDVRPVRSEHSAQM